MILESVRLIVHHLFMCDGSEQQQQRQNGTTLQALSHSLDLVV